MTVVKELDFEETQTYFVNIQASDKAAAPEKRRSALTVLTVHVTDSDDQVTSDKQNSDDIHLKSQIVYNILPFAGAGVGSPSVHQPGHQWPGGGGAGHLPRHATRHGQVS